MTLVLAIGCSDGVVIAADGLSMDETNIKTSAEKITRISGSPILYGQSGDVGLQQKMDESLTSVKPGTTMKATRRNIKRQTGVVFQESSESWVQYPAPTVQRAPGCQPVVCGHTRPQALDYADRDGQSRHHVRRSDGEFRGDR